MPNPDLAPEKLRTGEISITHAWTPDLVTSVDAFYTHVDDQIEIAGDIRTDTFLGVDNVALQAAANRGCRSRSDDPIELRNDCRIQGRRAAPLLHRGVWHDRCIQIAHWV